MTINHHPSESWLVAYATGNLPENFRRVVAAHVAVCDVCKQAVDDATTIAANMCDELPPVDLSLDIRALVNDLDDDADEPDATSPTTGADVTGNLVSTVNEFLRVGGIDALRWRTVAPGFKYVRLDDQRADDRLWLLRAAPNTVLPKHTHHGDEMTLVLKGAYFNGNKMFVPGDLEDADETDDHQPVIASDEECICLVATDAPLKFKGLLPRMAQPFIGL